MCFWLTFSRSETQSVALRLASRVVAHCMQAHEEVRLILPQWWGQAVVLFFTWEVSAGVNCPSRQDHCGVMWSLHKNVARLDCSLWI